MRLPQLEFGLLSSGSTTKKLRPLGYALTIISMLFFTGMAIIYSLTFFGIKLGAGWMALIILLSGIGTPIFFILFFRLYKSYSEKYESIVTNDLKASHAIDPEFPILSSTKLLAEKVDYIMAEVNSINLLTTLFLGWLLLALPFGLLVMLVLWLMHLAIPFGIMQLVGLEVLGIIVVGPLASLYKHTLEIRFLTQTLKAIDLQTTD